MVNEYAVTVKWAGEDAKKVKRFFEQKRYHKQIQMTIRNVVLDFIEKVGE